MQKNKNIWLYFSACVGLQERRDNISEVLLLSCIYYNMFNWSKILYERISVRCEAIHLWLSPMYTVVCTLKLSNRYKCSFVYTKNLSLTSLLCILNFTRSLRKSQKTVYKSMLWFDDSPEQYCHSLNKNHFHIILYIFDYFTRDYPLGRFAIFGGTVTIVLAQS